MAGNIATTTLINSVIRRLCQHPEIYQDLRDDPSLISGAIEETLRYDHSWPMSPRAVRANASKFTDGGSKALHNDEHFQSSPAAPEMEYGFPIPINIWRRARHDTVLGGQQIKAGQDVAVYISAANFDEAYFSHSEQFDIRRSPNPHLTFICGVHSCLGAPLARLEGRLALEKIVAHFSEIRLDPEKLPQYMGQMGPLEFTQSLDILLTKASSPTR
jgi:cytochrome P450